ncbi:MAG: PAS domain-containing protein [Planctomycetia bacterium]|nr:PAS domain-containing protein [Planctomycetia bacterium]
MARKRLWWHLYPSYLAVALPTLVAALWYAAHAQEAAYLASLAERLDRAAHAVDAQIGPTVAEADADRLNAACAKIADASGVDLAVLLANGRVLCRTADSPVSDEPGAVAVAEAPAALSVAGAGQPGHAETLPISRGGRAIGAIHSSVPAYAVQQAVRRIQMRMAGAGLLVAGCAAALCAFVSRRMSRPYEEMRDVAERFARGDMAYKLAGGDSEEMTGLAGALNRMAGQLEERLRTIVRQTSEQQAVLASMVEGVLAIDSDGRVITLNKAAAELVGNTLPNPIGRKLHEVVRNVDLRRFADRVLASDRPIEDDLILHGDPDRVLQIRGTGLRDAQRPGGMGAVVVLSDVTHFRRLETIRRDFVANVSHELKTPITSIKGFVETLLDGALHDAEDAERFLRIVATQADRLNAIIEDLLSLSKIEQSERAADLVVEDASIRDVLEAVLHDCDAKAAERRIDVCVECDDVWARINSPLLEQAVTNLLDNAIKYSEPGAEVFITAAQGESEVTIAVNDHGCGIDAEHLPRLFERFYRVDKARSRKLGGTGLGLAIVKHIVQAHHGRITVDSTPGVGSIFRIHLPPAGAPREMPAGLT